MENIEYFAKVQFFADKPSEGPGFFLSHPDEPGSPRPGQRRIVRVHSLELFDRRQSPAASSP
nr:hypothetical protein [Bacillaceae bacterium]